MKKATLGSIGITALYACSKGSGKEQKKADVKTEKKPIIISTWNHGLPANEEWTCNKKVNN